MRVRRSIAAMTVDLVAPDEALWVSWLESRDEWGGPQADQPGSALGVAQRLDLDLASRDGFGQWVQELLAQPEALPGPDIVPATNWWIVRDGRYLGAIQLRHSLNEFLADLGGHIGYGIRPSERRKGIASAALREVLTYAGDPVGLSRVLITCDETNAGSRNVIEGCGGLLDSVRPADQLSRNLGHSGDTLRYWAATGRSSAS